MLARDYRGRTPPGTVNWRGERRHPLPRAHRPAEPQAGLGRLGRLRRRRRLRRPPRHRVQRDPPGGGPDRRLAALQVPGHRARRRAPGRPRDHPGCHPPAGGAGVLHAVVRRARQGDRRRHRRPARRDELPLDGRRPLLSLAAHEHRRPRRRHPGRDRHGRRARAAGPRARAVLEQASGRRLVGRGLLPPPGGHRRRDRDRRHPHRLHGRPGLRALGRCRPRARAVGRRDRRGRRPRPAAGGDPGDGRRPRRGGPDPARGRLHERPPRDDRRARVHAVRDRARPAGQLRQARLHRPSRARPRPGSGHAGPAAGRDRARLGRHRGGVRPPRTGPGSRGDGQPRPDPDLLRRKPGRPRDQHLLVADAQEDDRAGIARAGPAPGCAARDRVVGRGRARPGRRDAWSICRSSTSNDGARPKVPGCPPDAS